MSENIERISKEVRDHEIKCCYCRTMGSCYLMFMTSAKMNDLTNSQKEELEYLANRCQNNVIECMKSED